MPPPHLEGRGSGWHRTGSAALLRGLAALALLAGACGDDGEVDGAGSTTTDPAPIERFLDATVDEVEEQPAAPTSSVPSTTVGGGKGIEHSQAALRVLGDDPRLDELAVACFGGDLGSCDDLYVDSPKGSLYEAYGATCGARVDQPTNLLCPDLLLPATRQDPAGLGGDPFLDVLAEQCHAGDLLDCDILYAEAEPDSAYERFGAGCAGRVDPDTDRDCTELLD